MRRFIVEATLELAIRDHLIPTPEGVAQKTGLPLEAVILQFPTLDELGLEIRGFMDAEFGVLDDAMPASGPLRGMLDALVDLRAELYEATASFRQLGDAGEQFLPSVAQGKAVQEGRYRGKLELLFSDHFPSETASGIIGQIELMTSWESWRHLRMVQCLSVERAKGVIRSVLNAVASTAPGP